MAALMEWVCGCSHPAPDDRRICRFCGTRCQLYQVAVPEPEPEPEPEPKPEPRPVVRGADGRIVTRDPLATTQIRRTICDYARAHGWRIAARGINTSQGWPDLLAIRDGMLVVAWINRKGGTGLLTAQQQAWLHAWSEVPGAIVCLWSRATIEYAYEVLGGSGHAVGGEP